MKILTTFLACFSLVGISFAQEEAKEEKPLPKCKTHEEVADRMIGYMDELVVAMSEIQDKESLATSTKKLEKIADGIVALSKNAQELDPPTDEQKEKLNAKMDAQEAGMEEKMEGAAAGIAKLDPESQQAFMAAMMKFGQKVEAAGNELEGIYEDEEEEEEEAAE